MGTKDFIDNRAWKTPQNQLSSLAHVIAIKQTDKQTACLCSVSGIGKRKSCLASIRGAGFIWVNPEVCCNLARVVLSFNSVAAV